MRVCAYGKLAMAGMMPHCRDSTPWTKVCYCNEHLCNGLDTPTDVIATTTLPANFSETNSFYFNETESGNTANVSESFNESTTTSEVTRKRAWSFFDSLIRVTMSVLRFW